MTRPKAFDRNLIILGAGAAGLVSAIVAVKAGAAVTLIEAGDMGGDCLNTGCVPSKALIHVAHLAHAARKAADMGLLPPPGPINSAAAFAHIRHAITEIAPHDSVERFAGLGVDVRKGHARITSPWSVEINGDTLTAPAIIAATGAAPAIPDIPGLDQTGYVTSETLWRLTQAPVRLLILGGGPIGCELAQAFTRLGSRVTLAFHGPRLLEREEPEVSALLHTQLAAEGVTLLPNHRPLSAGPGQMILVGEGQEIAIPFDTLLLATGRRPCTQGFGLEQLGVRLTPAGTIETNAYLQSSVPSLYACGDVAGPWQLTHAASHQAWHAAINALFAGLHRIRLTTTAMPAVTYTDPEIARIGLTETGAKVQGIPHEITHLDLAHLDRAITDNARTGFVKLITEQGRDRLLGATVVAPRAGEMLAELTLAMRHGIGLKKLFATIHPYPTYTEANRDAAGAWRRAHTPAWLLPLLTRYHRWRRG